MPVPTPVPASNTESTFEEVIGHWKATIRLVRGQSAWPTFDLSALLSTYVSLTTFDPSRLPEDFQRLRDLLLNQSPLGQHSARASLEAIVTNDPYLRLSCRTAWGLAKALEVVLLDQVARLNPLPDELPFAAAALAKQAVERLFTEPYSRNALVHAYNLVIEDQTIPLPELNAAILTLLPTDIPRVTGESTPTSRLHLTGTGNCFVALSDSSGDDDIQWLQAMRLQASLVVQILQYFKYELVSIDYVGLYFRPEWINRVWKTGIYLWGTPRQIVQTKPYLLRSSETPNFRRHLGAALRHRPMIEDTSQSLAKARRLAGEYYEAHFGRDTLEDRLLDLAISLEALFSPSAQMELSFRMAQSAALLVGASSSERKAVFALTKKVYDQRSGLVHGGGSPFTRHKLSSAELEQFGDIIRRAIIRFLAWQARGTTLRNEALRMLSDASLDDGLLRDIHAQTDIETFLAGG